MKLPLIPAVLGLCPLLSAAAGNVTVEFYSPETVRILKTAAGRDAVKPVSEVVIAAPQTVKVAEKTKGNATVYSTSALAVTIDGNGRVSFATPEGTVLLGEGDWSLTPIPEGPDSKSFKVKQTFLLDSGEPIYGLGMMQNGHMSQRGEHRLMMQSNLEDYSHFFQSIKGYGVYWDNYSPTQIDDDGRAMALESQVGDAVDYYFMYGGDADGVIAAMRRLTGKVPMVPLWTYGFHQSRERYKSAAELLEVVDRYRADGIPFDGIIQDWQYWGSNYNWNAMEFLNPEFKKAQEMIDRVHAANAHMSISIWASFGPETKGYKELKDKGLLFSFETWPQSGLPQWPPRMDYPSGVRVYDCYSPEARDIYWKNLKRLHTMGIDAWWMDSTDPDHHSYKDSDLDELCTAGTYRRVRNLFPFKTVGGVDGHQRAEDTTKRVFILTRSYFAGQQRYGSNTWSGDVASSWESLRNQVPICLNHTLSGNPNVNTDIGGFFANAYNRRWSDSSATRNPQYQELYTRWMQFGLFCPMMRSHGTEVNRELYHYGKPGEHVYDALVEAVKMRYRLLPYIYSTARRVSEDDDSFMRALFMDFREDTLTWDNNREFMFGRSLLVCPVVDPLFTQEKVVKTDAMSGWDQTANNGQGDWKPVDWSEAKTYPVYLPAGTGWYDFHTGNRYDGGQTIEANSPITFSPLYVREGSILPIGPDMQYCNEKPWDELTLRVYPGADGEFTLYEDEGDGYGYLQGLFAEIPMKWDDRKRTLTIGSRRGNYPGMLKERKFIVMTPDGKSVRTEYKGKKTTVKL